MIELDIDFEIEDLKFEWDDEKYKLNQQKHDVSFEMAAEVFLDENRIDNYDEFHSDDEDRFKVIGLVEKVLVVIYTERSDKYRIISARLANKKEKEEYYGQFYY